MPLNQLSLTYAINRSRDRRERFGWRKLGRRPLEWGPNFRNQLIAVRRTDPYEIWGGKYDAGDTF